MEEKNAGSAPEAGPEKKPSRQERPHILGGMIVLVTGISFLLATTELIDWEMWFAYFMVMLGAVFLIDVFVAWASPGYRGSGTGRLTAGVIIILVGLANMFDIGDWWPLIIIAVGAILLFKGLGARRKV